MPKNCNLGGVLGSDTLNPATLSPTAAGLGGWQQGSQAAAAASPKPYMGTAQGGSPMTAPSPSPRVLPQGAVKMPASNPGSPEVGGTTLAIPPAPRQGGICAAAGCHTSSTTWEA